MADAYRDHSDATTPVDVPDERRGEEMNRDCDTCVHHTVKGCDTWKCDYINVDDAVKAFKRIDGINLVFCNECKYCTERGEYPHYLYCKQWNTMTEEYGHCHKGEER